MARAIILDGGRMAWEYIEMARSGGGVILVTWKGKRAAWEIKNMIEAGVTVIEEPHAEWARSTYVKLLQGEILSW